MNEIDNNPTVIGERIAEVGAVERLDQNTNKLERFTVSVLRNARDGFSIEIRSQQSDDGVTWSDPHGRIRIRKGDLPNLQRALKSAETHIKVSEVEEAEAELEASVEQWYLRCKESE